VPRPGSPAQCRSSGSSRCRALTLVARSPAGQWEQDADLRALVAKEVPLQRLGQEHEMGALIAFLASGKATPVTGQFFGFTGGWLP
jgi:NAD(P)-dependent dehydrogenase (short-subunit alcohol dehydrogenase family)